MSEEDASLVHALGDFEYKYVGLQSGFCATDPVSSYIWNTAQNASEYNALTFGVMYKELASNFQSFAAGKETRKARLYVGHDGSMVRATRRNPDVDAHAYSYLCSRSDLQPAWA